MKAQEQNKERKQKIFPINLEERIRNSSSGLTIEEVMKMVSGYKREFSKVFKIVKKGEKINYMEIPEKARFNSMKSRAEIEDIELDAIIDTGAAVSAITRGLMKELGYKINQSSNVKIINANGVKTRSLGKISDMELTVSGIDTRVTVEVIESEDSTLILGNDWLKKVKAQIDMNKGKVSIKGVNGFVDIPIEFSTGKEENDDKEYEEEELRKARF